ncbi:MAG: Maf family protein [Vibrio sp.]
MQLILASTSPFRRQILDKLQLDYQCLTPDCDETPQPGESAQDLVARLAEKKAISCAPLCDAPSLIIGSDQVCVLNDKIVGKPLTKDKAKLQLHEASGKSVYFYTGLSVYNTQTQQAHTIVEPFQVHFKPLTEAMIEAYIDKDMPLHCAGSFKSEGLGISLFKKLEGDDPNTLIGLPLIRLIELLEKQGFTVL